MSLGNRIYAELQGDRAIWAIVAVLALVSILTVYSATGSMAFRADRDTEYFLVYHSVFVLGGLFMTYLCYLLHYTKFNKIAPTLLLIAIPLLVFTLAYGVDTNDARRWIRIPFLNYTFQTSDFAKLALIIYVSRMISAKQEYINDFASAFLPIIVPVIIICGLIAPADLSTAMLLLVTCMLMMFIGRVNWKYILLLFFLGIVVFACLIIVGQVFPEAGVRSGTWITRMSDFMTDQEGVYQVQQAKIAIADGGWFGLGPGNSVQRNYLPEAYSDFIFAIICEEYGLFGGFIVICLYVMLLFRCVSIVTRSPKAFGAMLALGLCFIIVLQALANIAVSVHLVPVTGLTLPLISKGGTSIIFTSIAFGMILSVSRYIEKVQ